MSIIHEALKKAQSDLEKQGNLNSQDNSEGKNITKLYEELHRPFAERPPKADPPLAESKDSVVREKSPQPSAKPAITAQPLNPKTASANTSPSPAQRGSSEEMTQHLRTSPAVPTKKSWFKLVLTLVSLFLVGTGVLFGVFLYLLDDSSQITPNVIQPQFSKTGVAPVPTEENPLILSGTMMMGDKRVALINNGIYEVGEFVEGKKVTAIALEKVELLDGENIIILKAK